MEVELITRAGCHLCDEALALLRASGCEPRLTDVDADPRLLDEYGWRVPVILVEGHIAAEGAVTLAVVRRALSSR
ncbi:MAG: glutaredoxin family protein [Candidatus Dormibacteraceae bacterium]